MGRPEGGSGDRRGAEPNTESFPRVAFEDDELAGFYMDYAGGSGGPPSGPGGPTGLGGPGGGPGGPGFGGAVEYIATPDPSDLVRRYLYPTEKFRGEWRRHWIHLVRRLSIGVIATFILGYLAGYLAKQQIAGGLTVLVLIWVIVMLWVLWQVVEWYYDRFVLTNKRIMLVEGIIARRVAMMPLARVTDMKYTQSPMGRVLNFGTFEIESAGQDQALRNVSNLPNPTDLYLQVVEEMYEPEASEARRSGAGGQPDDGS
jgi:membrane protein YdbS with pleckstrin-like domain